MLNRVDKKFENSIVVVGGVSFYELKNDDFK